MTTFKCEWCESEQDEQPGIAKILQCKQCKTTTWHYPSDRFAELRNMSSVELAKVLNPPKKQLVLAHTYAQFEEYRISQKASHQEMQYASS